MLHNPRPAKNRLSLSRLSVAVALTCLCAVAHSMDLLEAYQAAQKNDANILSSRASAQADRESVLQARAQMLPNIYASASRNNNRLTSTTPNFLGAQQTSQSTYPSESKSVTLRQPLYRPQLLTQYRQTQAQVEDSEASLQAEEQNLAVRVSGAYFDALQSNDQLALVMAQQAVFVTQVDAMGKMLAAGSGTRTDVDEAQARLDMNRAQEIEARQNVIYALQQLQVLVLEPLDELATLNIDKLDLQAPQPESVDEWIGRAEKNSPQLQSLAARVEVARLEASKASAGHRPTLDAVLQWSDSLSDSTSNLSTRYVNNSVGVQLNIPIYAGGAVSSLVRQALLRQERAEQQLEASRRDLVMRVRKEFRAATESIPKIRALELALRSAEQLVISSQKSYQAGSRTVVDILNAEQQRASVMRDLAQARYSHLYAKVRLLALVGDANAEAVATLNAAFEQP